MSFETLYEPLCFRKESLDPYVVEEFNVDHFIGECRKRVPLESLLNDLKLYSQALDNQLVELINKDYADFVNLSSNLVGVDKILLEIRKPLAQMKNEILSLNNSMQESISILESKLSERKDLLEKKNILFLFISVSQSISRIEKLLHIEQMDPYEQHSKVSPPIQNEVLSSLNECRGAEIINLIERVANEFNQLKFFVSKGCHLPFISKQEKRITFIENSLGTGLEKLFYQSLTNKNSNLLSSCLRTYSAIDKMKTAEELFRTWIVRPFSSKIITIEHLNSPETATVPEKKSPNDGLEWIYSNLLKFIEDQCMIVLEVTRSIHGFNFLCNSIWSEFSEAIIHRLGSKIFNAAYPDLFHKNFIQSSDFLCALEARFCYSIEEVQLFRSCSASLEFLKMWKLNVYFKLRFQEIAITLEQSLREISDEHDDYKEISKENPSYNDGLFALKSIQTLWNCLKRCWREDTFLLPLTDRFFKLTLQLLSRYISWIEFNLNFIADNSVSHQQNITRPSDSGASLALPTPSNHSVQTIEPNQSRPPILESTKPYQSNRLWWLRLFHDNEELAKALKTFYTDFVKNHFLFFSSSIENQTSSSLSASAVSNELSVDHPDSQRLKAIEDSYLDIVPYLEKVSFSIAERICSYTIKRCCEGLQSLRGITAAYRMTNKATPTERSMYVDHIVAPIEEFLHEGEQFLGKKNKLFWMEYIISAVTERYIEMTSDILNMVVRAEAVRNRMVKSKSQLSSSSSRSSGTLSDIDKIYIQLHLDVDAYGQLLENKFGLNKHHFEPYQRLLSCVSNEKKAVNQPS